LAGALRFLTGRFSFDDREPLANVVSPRIAGDRQPADSQSY
jgi:hypothetical protein